MVVNLDLVLAKFGFGETWRKWIIKCITSPMFPIIIK